MRGIEHLHPELQPIARKFEADCKAAGLNVLITETFRTTAEQDALYAQGRTKPGNIVTNCRGSDYQSPHQWGVAFDFCKNIRGQEYDDKDGFFKKCGEVAKKLGLFWGGDFKSFVDKPHVEWASKFLPSNSTATLKRNHGTPDKFKATWSATTPSASAATPPQEGNKTRATVRLNSRGDDVKYLQGRLNTLQTVGLVADGIFGPKTDAAVRTFQRSKGLVVDGIAGPKTWAAIG